MKDLFLDEDGAHVFKELPNSELEPLNILEPMLDTKRQWLVIRLKSELKVKEKILIKLEYQKLTNTSKDPDVAFVKYSFNRKIDENLKLVNCISSIR